LRAPTAASAASSNGTAGHHRRLDRSNQALRLLLRMRLDIDRWSRSPSRTVLELIPCRRVRPTATYYWAGHLLLDSLTHSLARRLPAQRFAPGPDRLERATGW